MTSPVTQAVLFDIDGTLLDFHQAGKRAFSLALAEQFGWVDDLSYIQFAGATDLDVIRRICAHHDHPCSPAIEAAFFETLPRHLTRTAASSHVTVFPGVRSLLTELERDAGSAVGLVTGNIEACARIKLKQAGLEGSFTVGAFGHEHADRVSITRLALDRVRAHAHLPHDCRAFLIGDTPADMHAAAVIGLGGIGVATGHYSVGDLQEAGASLAVENLSDPSVRKWLGL